MAKTHATAKLRQQHIPPNVVHHLKERHDTTINHNFICLGLTVNIYSQDKTLLTKPGDLTYCLDSTEFKLEFYYGQSKQDINKILGKPDSIRINEGLSEFHYYEGIRFDFNNIGTVYRIAVSSDK